MEKECRHGTLHPTSPGPRLPPSPTTVQSWGRRHRQILCFGYDEAAKTTGSLENSNR